MRPLEDEDRARRERTTEGRLGLKNISEISGGALSLHNEESPVSNSKLPETTRKIKTTNDKRRRLFINYYYYYSIFIVISSLVDSLESTSNLSPTWLVHEQHQQRDAGGQPKSTVYQVKQPNKWDSDDQLLEVASSSLQPAVVAVDGSEGVAVGNIDRIDSDQLQSNAANQQRAQRRSSFSDSTLNQQHYHHDVGQGTANNQNGPRQFRVAHISESAADRVWSQTLPANDSNSYTTFEYNPVGVNQTNLGVNFDEQRDSEPELKSLFYSKSSSDSNTVRAASAGSRSNHNNEDLIREIPVQPEEFSAVRQNHTSSASNHKAELAEDLIDSTQPTNEELNRTTTTTSSGHANNSSVWFVNEQPDSFGSNHHEVPAHQNHDVFASHDPQRRVRSNSSSPTAPVAQLQGPQTIYYLSNGDKWNSAEFHHDNHQRPAPAPSGFTFSPDLPINYEFGHQVSGLREPPARQRFNSNLPAQQSSSVAAPMISTRQYPMQTRTTPIPSYGTVHNSATFNHQFHRLPPQPVRRRPPQQYRPAFPASGLHHHQPLIQRPNRRLQQPFRPQQFFADDYSPGSKSSSFLRNPISALIRPGSPPTASNRPRKSLLGSLGNKLNNWGSSAQSLNDAANNPHAALENYFYNSAGDQSTADRTRNYHFPAHEPQLGYGNQMVRPLAAPLPFYTTGNGRIQQPTVAPASSTLANHHNHHLLAANQHRKPSHNVHHPMSQQGSQQPASFIPVVAVQVTRTSPAPTRLPLSQDEAQQVQSNSPEMSGAEIEEYLEAKTGKTRNSNSGRLPAGAMVNYDDYGSFASGSNSAPTMRGGVNNPAQRLPMNDQHTTTIKSAVFGYLPHQADGPLLQAIRLMPQLNPGQPSATPPRSQQSRFTPAASSQMEAHQQFYAQQMDRSPQSVGASMAFINQQQPVAYAMGGGADEAPSLALQLQANSLVQNDIIAHPFALAASAAAAAAAPTLPAAYDTSNLLANANSFYQAQQSPQQSDSNSFKSASPLDVYSSDQFHLHGFQLVPPSSASVNQMASAAVSPIEQINPLLFADPSTAAFSGTAHQPMLSAAQHPKQQLATSASDMANLFYPQFGQMLPMAGNQLDQQPAVSGDSEQQPQEQQAEQGAAGNNIGNTLETTRNQLSNNKGKKRSSEFFANAGQLLLSALPLLLAPTLGLMFASPSSSSARYHEPSMQPSSSFSSSSPSVPIPGTYINSLSSGQVSNSAAPQYFTPSPPAYATTTTTQQSTSSRHNNHTLATRTRSPNTAERTSSSLSHQNKPKSGNSIAALTGLRMSPASNQTNSAAAHRPGSAASTIIVSTLSPSPVYSNSSSSLFVNKSDHHYLLDGSLDEEEQANQANHTIASPSTTILLLDDHSSALNGDDENGVALGLNETSQPISNHYEYQNSTLVDPLPPIEHQSSAVNRTSALDTRPLYDNPNRRVINSTKDESQPTMPTLPPINRPAHLDTSYQGADFDAQFATLKKSNHRAQSHGANNIGPLFEYIPATPPSRTSTTTSTTTTTTTTTNKPTQKYAKNKNQYQYSQVQPLNPSGNNNILSYATLANSNDDYELGEILTPMRKRHRPASVYKNSSRFDDDQSAYINQDPGSIYSVESAAPTTELYPVSTWPQARRKTVSLVTSSGNRTLFDSSDRYQLVTNEKLQQAPPVITTSARPQHAASSSPLVVSPGHRGHSSRNRIRVVSSPSEENDVSHHIDGEERIVSVLPAPADVVAANQRQQQAAQDQPGGNKKRRRTLSLTDSFVLEKVETTESLPTESTAPNDENQPKDQRQRRRKRELIAEPDDAANATTTARPLTGVANSTAMKTVSRFGKDARVRIRVKRVKTTTTRQPSVDKLIPGGLNKHVNSNQRSDGLDASESTSLHLIRPQMSNSTSLEGDKNQTDPRTLAVNHSTISSNEPMRRDSTRKSAIVTAMITHDVEDDSDADENSLLENNDEYPHYSPNDSDSLLLRDQLLRKKIILDRIASGQGQRVNSHRPQVLETSHEGVDNSILSEQFNYQPEASNSLELAEEDDFSLGGRGRIPTRLKTAGKKKKVTNSAALELAEDTKKALAKFGTLLLEDTLQIPESKNVSLSRRRKSARDRQTLQLSKGYDSYEGSATERYARATPPPPPLDDWAPGTRYSPRVKASSANEDVHGYRLPDRDSRANFSDDDSYAVSRPPHGSYGHQQHHSQYPSDLDDNRNGHGYSASLPMDSRQRGGLNETQPQVSPINRYHRFMETNQVNQTTLERPQQAEHLDARYSSYSNYTTVAPLNDQRYSPQYNYPSNQATNHYESDYRDDRYHNNQQHHRPSDNQHPQQHHHHQLHHQQQHSSYAGQYSQPSRNELAAPPPHQNSADYMPPTQLPRPTGDYAQQNFSSGPSSYPPSSTGAYNTPPQSRRATDYHQHDNQHSHNQYPSHPPMSADSRPPPPLKPDYHWPPPGAIPPSQHYAHPQQPDHYNYGGSHQHSGSYARQHHDGNTNNYPPPLTNSDWSLPYGHQHSSAGGYGSSSNVPPPISSFGPQPSSMVRNGGVGGAMSTTDNTRVVDEYLKRAQFSDSDRDKLMASYLTCDGLLNDNDHCLERLSCEFSDPQNIEKANKLDRAVSSILLGHILINTYIPNHFKQRLKSASVFGYTQSGRCSKYVCHKLISRSTEQSSGSGD